MVILYAPFNFSITPLFPAGIKHMINKSVHRSLFLHRHPLHNWPKLAVKQEHKLQNITQSQHLLKMVLTETFPTEIDSFLDAQILGQTFKH